MQPDQNPEAAVMGNPPGLTDAEKLTALDTYLKMLKPLAEGLRVKVEADLRARRVERVGAYLPDGTKLGAVAHSPGNKTAKVTDQAAALRWCLERYPDEVVQAVNPAFLKMLTDHAKGSPVGSVGVDPRTGEALPFIAVMRGSPYVTVTTTDEGVERLEALALGFAGMLEGSK